VVQVLPVLLTPNESDDSSGQAVSILSGVPQTHSICPVGDEDWMTFDLTSDSAVLLKTSGSSGDTQMWLYDSSLNEIEFNEDGGTNFFSRIDRVCDIDELPAGTYYVKIGEFGNDNEIASYDISLTVGQCGIATYDATGTWWYSETNNWANPGNAGCTPEDDETGTAVITQTGDNVKIVAKGITYTGTVNGADYTVTATYPENGGTTTVDVNFTLSSDTSGSGTVTWSWTDNTFSCNGEADLSIIKYTDVTWVDRVGVDVVGNCLTKSASDSFDNGGAASLRILTGDGGVRFQVSQTGTYSMFGLSSTNTDASYKTIEYAIYLRGGRIYVYEDGALHPAGFGSYQTGDLLSVEREGDLIVYKKNGEEFHTGETPINAYLLVDCAIYSNGGEICDAELFGIVSNGTGGGDSTFSARGKVLGSDDATPLPGTGLSDLGSADANLSYGYIQCIYAGADGTIDPPNTDGSTTGDDVLLGTAEFPGQFFTAVGEGFPFTPDGQFFEDFTHSLDVGAMIYCRAWNNTTPSTSTMYGDSTLYALAAANFDENDFRTWSTVTPTD
jgi:hypothetical protein